VGLGFKLVIGRGSSGLDGLREDLTQGRWSSPFLVSVELGCVRSGKTLEGGRDHILSFLFRPVDDERVEPEYLTELWERKRDWRTRESLR